tara:strand:+ start:107 stop:1138 length:1032 start_codon:yes stop_codon:yes gene_type:complete
MVIKILKPVIKVDNNKTVITYKYSYNSKEYSFQNKFLSFIPNIYSGIEGLISLFIPHCILTGTEIISDISIDRNFYNNIQNLVPIFKKWHKNDNLSLNLNIPIINKERKLNRKVITTFTLGVDSFYTLYSKLDEIDTIIFIIGFDVKKENTYLLEQVFKNLKEVSILYNKELILCESDIQNKVKHGDGFQWGPYFHGPALFSIIYSLSNIFETFYIASTHPSKDDYIWGSLFILDKNYSSFLKIEHDGDLTRVEKLKYLLTKDIRCLNYLRVCYKNKRLSKYNCTNCEKCLRTLYAIQILGYKDKAITFDKNICGEKYWEFRPKNNSSKSFQREIKKLLQESK